MRFWIMLFLLSWLPAAFLAEAQEPPAPSTQPLIVTVQPELRGVEKLREEARRLEPFVSAPLARAFLRQTETLPNVVSRPLFRHTQTGDWLSYPAAENLPEAEKPKLRQVTADEQLFYYTRYGSPLVYVRLLDLLAKHHTLDGVEGRRILDFGYGSIGQLRLLAQLGADAVGTDVSTMLQALYEEPGDQGAVPRAGKPPGRVTCVHGRWPADADARATVGGGFDLITSKNTLKRGYVHPAEPIAPADAVQLGVADEAFVAALFEALKPGGYLLIYNICPARAAPGENYVPWADGECPFPRALLEERGFRVLAFDERDEPAIAPIFEALDYPVRKADGSPDLFVWYTLAQRPR